MSQCLPSPFNGPAGVLILHEDLNFVQKITILGVLCGSRWGRGAVSGGLPDRRISPSPVLECLSV